ncbi:hypothetical protein F4808DRAFT_405813 [Astrocystis sublimbata]|nr:hypothetical protein F4808DRAFT_405813 [Astrocystis sublimbata]
MALPLAAGLELLRSGKYSDLTLLCEDQEFRVHKSVVCILSPVIAASMKEGFTEAKTSTLKVEFDAKILKCMLDFMYMGTYEYAPQGSEPTSSEGGNPQAQGNSTDTQAKQALILSDSLIHHAKVNSIADYYGLATLATFSVNEIEKLLTENWSADAFCDLLQEAIGSTGDKGFRQSIVKWASNNVFELMDKDLFSEGKLANDIAAEVLAKCTKSFKNISASNGKLEAVIRDKNNSLSSHKAHLAMVAKDSSKRHVCLNPGCKQGFGHEIKVEPNGLGLKLCCSKCGSRFRSRDSGSCLISSGFSDV